MTDFNQVKTCARYPREEIKKLDPKDFVMQGGFILKKIGRMPIFHPSTIISTDVLTGALPDPKASEQILTAIREQISRPGQKGPKSSTLNLYLSFTLP